MLKFNLPKPPVLLDLLDMLTNQGVEMYLFGFLPGSEMAFVDIDSETAGRLANEQLPSGWTLIYPFFMSSDALCRNESDPLLRGVPVQEILQAYTPTGFTQQTLDENVQILIDQAEYLMQFPPSRLVWLKGGEIPETSLFALKKVLRASKTTH